MEVAVVTRDEAEARLSSAGDSLLHRTAADTRHELLLSLRLRSEVRCCELSSGLAQQRTRSHARLATTARSIHRLLPRSKTRPSLLGAGVLEGSALALQPAHQQGGKLATFLQRVGPFIAELCSEVNYLEVAAEAVSHRALQALLLLRPFVVLPRRAAPGRLSVSFLLCHLATATAASPPGTSYPFSIGYVCLEIDFAECRFLLVAPTSQTLGPTQPDPPMPVPNASCPQPH